MFRLAGWRLTAMVMSTPLLQKTTITSSTTLPQEPVAVQPEPRRFGTVVSFMHRRGYGFLRESALPPTAKKENSEKTPVDINALENDAMTKFFFPRSSLDGGFYLQEGQTVAFDVRMMRQTKKMKARLDEAKYDSSTSSSSSVSTSTESTDAAEGNDEQSKLLSVAHHIRLYDALSGKEKPVTPIMLFGYVDAWDQLAGTGIIAELDLNGNLHDDAPRFTVSLEDLDLAGSAELRRGRYVRFCLEAGDHSAARRVIIDRSAEKENATRLSGDTSGEPETRHYGTVREIVEGRFGFILLDNTGESVFFHLSNAEGDGVKQGDTVSFVMREVMQGKHVGKRTCIRVRRCTERKSTQTAAAAGQRSKSAKDIDADEFELLD